MASFSRGSWESCGAMLCLGTSGRGAAVRGGHRRAPPPPQHHHQASPQHRGSLPRHTPALITSATIEKDKLCLLFLMIQSQTPFSVVQSRTMHLARGDRTLEQGCRERTVEGPALRPRARLAAHHEGLRAESGSRCVITARILSTTVPTTPPSRWVRETLNTGKNRPRGRSHWGGGMGDFKSILIYFTRERRGVGGK